MTLIFLDVLSLFKEMRFPGAQEGRLTPHQGAEGPGVQGIEVSVLGWFSFWVTRNFVGGPKRAGRRRQIL